jgi:putative FmdB family regulatory protein
MPTYEYECCVCGELNEGIFPMSNIPEGIECFSCGGHSKRVLSKCAAHCDSAPWIDDGLRGCLQRDGEKPVETKSDLKAYCKANDIIQTG